MRRALIASAGTIVGLVALLDYKSSGGGGISRVAVGPGAPSTPTTTAPPPTGVTPSPSATTPPATSPPATAAPAAAQYTSTAVAYRYGDIAVRITVAGGRIANVAVPLDAATDGRSQSINSQAVPILTKEALAAQNLNFDVVSGATFTSDAFAQALQSALAKAGR